MSDTTASPPETAPEEGVPHPYHLVNPSPWPLVGALSGGVMAVGGILLMHYGTLWLFFVGLAGILFTMFMWWRDVIDESIRQRAHSAVTKIGLRYGMNLFIASYRFNKPLLDLYRAAWPFMVVLLIALLLITYVPVLSLGLIT